MADAGSNTTHKSRKHSAVGRCSRYVPETECAAASAYSAHVKASTTNIICSRGCATSTAETSEYTSTSSSPAAEATAVPATTSVAAAVPPSASGQSSDHTPAYPLADFHAGETDSDHADTANACTTDAITAEFLAAKIAP